MNTQPDEFCFAPEESVVEPASKASWKVLIVDDEKGIHDVTVLALKNFEFDGRRLNFLHAYSAAEARVLLLREPDIALALVDVVMETEHAGLDLVCWLRSEARNKHIRVVLRTGQPGQAPEGKVIRDYDINDYKEKTELTAQKLFSTVFTSLRAYRDIMALEINRHGLLHIIQASGQISRIRHIDRFIQATLEQLTGLLYLDRSALYLGCDCVAVANSREQLTIVAATGRFEFSVGQKPADVLDSSIMALISEVLVTRQASVQGASYIGVFSTRRKREEIIYLTGPRTLDGDDLALIEMFMNNLAVTYENALLRDEIEATQRDMVYMLGEAVESRSKETGQHVRRVGEYCRLMALGLGLTEYEAEVLHVAAPLHDFGKIAIGDHILHKAGPLTPEEWLVMQTHAQAGADMLGRSSREILQLAAIVAGQHHERWDGTGYPKKLAGDAIHIAARICAVADVFDALASKRAYKVAWSVDDAFNYLVSARGGHFDPTIIDWVMANQVPMLAIFAAYPDNPGSH